MPEYWNASIILQQLLSALAAQRPTPATVQLRKAELVFDTRLMFHLDNQIAASKDRVDFSRVAASATT